MYRIGELAKLANVTPDTIRYYEKSGLLAQPARSRNGYRLYGDEDVERLKFIRHCRAHGMALHDIKELLTLRETPDRDCSLVNELVDKHIADVETRIRSLQHLKSQLVRLRKKCSHGGAVATCGILKGLGNRDLCGCQGEEGVQCDS